MELTLSRITNYHSKYKNSLWGAKNFNTVDYEIRAQLIIQNRNKFIEEYDIKRLVMKVPQFIKREVECDYSECYITNKREYIVIIGSYLNNKQYFIERNWIPIISLFSTNTVTYMKVLSSKKK